MLVGGPGALPGRLAELLAAGSVMLDREPAAAADMPAHDALVYLAQSRGPDGVTPDAEDAATVLERSLAAGAARLVVVSSTAAYHPSPRHAGLLDEQRLSKSIPHGSVAHRWLAFEATVRQKVDELRASERLTILRSCPVPLPGGHDGWSRRLGGRVAAVVWGYDPPLQFLSLEDLAGAIAKALSTPRPGSLYNLAPRSVIPLRSALRRTGCLRLALPDTLHRVARQILGTRGRIPLSELAYVRYPSTVSAGRAARDLAWRPRHGSVEALARNFRLPAGNQAVSTDPFGFDRAYIRRLGRTLFRFLHDLYWRVEHRGLEHVPREGGGVLVGIHRGYQPWDGVMILHLLARSLGRFPRFLIHPALVVFPFLAPYMTKLGGLLACRENADWVLDHGHLVGIFPEGIRGAFCYYRDAHRLQRFGRDEFVRLALRHRVPIVPFATLGSAESLPLFGKLRWRWWQRWSGWPCLPVAPPLPLPAKWHTVFLEPLPTSHYPPGAEGDRHLVAELRNRVRERLQTALDDLRQRRRRIFYGSIFEDQEA